MATVIRTGTHPQADGRQDASGPRSVGVLFLSRRSAFHDRLARGTLADFQNARATGQRERRQLLERTGGRMFILSGRLNGKIFISVGAYQPGATNTKEELRELAELTLADFSLPGEIH